MVLMPLHTHRKGVKARFNGHPPLGVNATSGMVKLKGAKEGVSMGTHPWG